MAFEMTEMRKNIFKYMAKIGDILTNPEDVERYLEFTNAIHELAEATDSLYAPDSDGNYPQLNDENLSDLKKKYQAVLKTGYQAAAAGEGEVAGQLSAIATEITLMAEKDMAALEVADTKKGMTLPEVVSNGRTLTVGIGNQPLEVKSGNMSARIPIDILNPDGTFRKGFFTQTSYVNTMQSVEALEKKMLQKYPAYGEVFTVIKSLNDRQYSVLEFTSLDIMASISDGDNNQEKKEDTISRLKYNLTNRPLNLPEDLVDQWAARDDFLAFMDDMSKEMSPIVRTKHCYTDPNTWLGLKEGANIDKRNAAMSTVSKLLGKPGLIANAEPMVVMIDGKPVSGTFMEKVPGVDVHNLKENEIEVKTYGPANFSDSAVFDDIAALQAIDFICGNLDRHTGNMFMNFDPNTKKLVGIKGIDNDMSFGLQNPAQYAYGNIWIKPSAMGVIGENTATAILGMTQEMLSFTLSGYGLSNEEISAAWVRTEALQQAIREGMEYYANRNPGELDREHLRVVPQEQWTAYKVEDIAAAGNNQFTALTGIAQELAQDDLDKHRNDLIHQNAIEILGLPAEEPQVEEPPKPDIVAVPVGNGLQQNAAVDRYGVKSPETIKLVLGEGEELSSVGGAMSRRHPLQYEINGQQSQGFFTASSNLDMQQGLNRIMDDAIRENGNYAKELEALRAYYLRDVRGMNILLNVNEFPYEDLGFSPQKVNQLRTDEEFKKIFKDTHERFKLFCGNLNQYINTFRVAEGSTVERRNVAMSKMGTLLGVPDLLAKSTIMQLQIGDHIEDGIFTETAKGVDIARIKAGDPITTYGPEVYDNGAGLKSLAELQILDYICLNVDRHTGNMMYQFSEGPEPKFIGVIGIDNDLSFGTTTPNTNERVLNDTPLDLMNKISTRMAEKILNTTPEDLEQTLKDQGMGQKEILAAQERLARVQNRLETGKIQVLTDEQWNALKLSDLAVEGTIFAKVQEDLITNMPQKVQQLQQAQNQSQNPQPLQYAKTTKVDAFNEQAVEKTKLEKDMRKTDEKIQKDMQELVQRYRDIPQKSDGELFHEANQGAQVIYKIIDDADPSLMRSSVYYRDMKKEAKELKELTKRVENNVKNGIQPTVQQTEEMISRMSSLNAKIVEYIDYKLDTVNGNEAAFNRTEEKRVLAAKTSGTITSSLIASYSKNDSLRLIESNALRSINQGIATIQNDIDYGNKSPEEVNTLVATMIYYKVMSVSDKKLGKKITTALSPEAKNDAVSQIKNSAGFKEMMKAGNEQIIRLAREGNGDNLYKNYLKEMAKENNKEQHAANRAVNGPVVQNNNPVM